MGPAMEAAKKGNLAGRPKFLQRTLAVQMCKAKMEANVPADFWPWMEKQGASAMKAVFSTFPVNSNQLKLISDLRIAVGKDAFDQKKMLPFAVAVSYLNRFKDIDQAVTMPHPNYEINGYEYLKHQLAEAKQAMLKGKHCNIQSNECRDLNKCCGAPHTWKFKWPRDPSPSVKEWAEWWSQKVDEHKKKLWWNPLSDVPWIFGLYVWPSPLKECEWVHEKLIAGKPIENGGKWYKYDANFHRNFCSNGKKNIHPDGVPGIAVYGGVCGRMAQLEWRKTSCMGMPATMKGEPGHCAGFKFVPGSGDKTTLSVGNRGCLVCARKGGRCSYSSNPSACSKFLVQEGKAANELDMNKKLVEVGTNQCLDLHGRGIPGLWGCNGGVHQKWRVQGDRNFQVSSSARGTFTVTRAPQEKANAKKTSWRIEGIHEIKCTKANCHYNSATANLDSSNLDVTRKTHREAAVAAVEAYNEYEQDGVWPVAHDEARLAASVAVAMRSTSPALAETSLSWALDRNPAVHEIWETASEHFTQLHSQRSSEREKLNSRKWYRKHVVALPQVDASITSLEAEALAVAAAERFAQDRLLSAKHEDFLNRNPVLKKSLLSQVCGVLTAPDNRATSPNGTLAELVGCQVTQTSSASNALAKNISQNISAAADGPGQTGNPASEAFEEMLDELKSRLANNVTSTAAKDDLRKLLNDLSVGYVNVRSETFFAEHGRVLLRGPYAHLLKTAGMFLEMGERKAFANQTKIILTNPDMQEYADRIHCDDQKVLDSFIDWATLHRFPLNKFHASENAAVSDDVDGGKPLDGAGLEVMEQLALDQDAEAELAEEDWSADYRTSHSRQDTRHDLGVLLTSLLNLEPSDKSESPDSTAFLEIMTTQMPLLSQPVDIEENFDLNLFQQQAENALSECVEDVESRFSASFWMGAPQAQVRLF